MPLVDLPKPFLKKTEPLRNLNDLWNENYPNDGKATKIRQLLEKMFKQALRYPENETMPLSKLFASFKADYSTFGFENTARNLIQELNKWAHHSGEELSDDGLKQIFDKTSTLFEKLTGLKNKNKPWEVAPAISLLDYAQQLNEAQKRAVNSKSELTLVEAGPGTGKTELVAARMISVSKSSDFKSSNKKLAGISFTNQATNELKTRLEKNQGGDWISEDDPFECSTIHAFCLHTLAEFEEANSRPFNYKVIDSDEHKNLKEVFGGSYENHLEKEKLLTYDGILELMSKKLHSDSNFQAFIRDKFYEIVIDEAQDLNKSQYQIFTMLHKFCGARLFFVGDQRQNIYKFTGGSMSNLKESFPQKDIAHYALEYSYRCPQAVLDFVNKFEFQDCKNLPLQNTLANPKNSRVELEAFLDEEEESVHIVKKIKALLEEQKVEGNEIAVLSSSIFHLQSIANQLNESEISYEVFGGQQTLRSTISLFCEVLELLHTRKTISLLKIAHQFGINISFGHSFDESLKLIVEEAQRTNRSSVENLLQLLDNFNPDADNSLSELMARVLEVFVLLNEASSKGDAEINELKEFIFQVEKSGVEDIKILKSVLNPANLFFRQFFQRAINLKSKSNNSRKSIVLSTIHSAKGREWDYVFLSGLTEGIMPHYNSKDINDDLKKFYVACTRTRHSLFLSYPRTYNVRGFGHQGNPSRFLAPLI